MSYDYFTYRLHSTVQIFVWDKHIFTVLKNMLLSICPYQRVCHVL